MDIALYQLIRDYELSSIISGLPSGGHILELGAGSGWQAKRLSEHGFTVEAVDLEAGKFVGNRVWDIRPYDGITLPFPTDSFDAVFSSNVLEHVEHPDALQKEIHRVLRSDGVAIHVVPTATWRLWTNASHYLFAARVLLSVIIPALRPEDMRTDQAVPQGSKWRALRMVRKALFPFRHGAKGNFLSELFLFSRLRWQPFFRRTGWNLETRFPNGVFYTGYFAFGSLLGVAARKRISKVMGSSCMAYVLGHEK